MDCTRVEEMLALFVGADLDARQTERVRAHLAGCAACQARADEWTASRAWLRATPPQFDEAFYAGLRQSVLRELAARENAGGRFDRLFAWLPQWRWQPVWAAAALLLLAGWAVYRITVGQSSDVQPAYAVATPSPAALPPDVRKVSDLPGQVSLSSRGYAPDRWGRSPNNSRVTMPGGRRPPAHRVAEPQEVGATDATLVAQANEPDTDGAKPEPAKEPELTRIEFQTADPNIRIIWFAPKPDTAAPANK